MLVYPVPLGLTLLLSGGAWSHAEPQWTDTERAFLERTTHLRVCADPSAPPFEFIGADGRHQGIAAGVLDEVAAITGLAMRIVPSRDWAETLGMARRGECDLVPMLNATPARAEFLDFTRPYVTFENAIVTHRPAYHRGLASLAGKSLALPRDYRFVELIDSLYPDIEIVLVDHTEAALRAVSAGHAYATLVSQQLLVNHVQRLRLSNVHFAGSAALEDRYRIGVPKTADPALVGILDRALAGITDDQIGRIMERWYVVPVEPSVSLRAVVSLAAVAAALFAFLLLHLYHRSRYYGLLDLKNRELERLSSTDALTGTANRRALDVRLAEEVERARRHRRDLAIILFDLDEFKQINDGLGHQVGDQVLIEMVSLAAASQRLTDVLGRWGGDEFLIICPDTTVDEANVVAGRVSDAVAAHAFHDSLRLTISFGIAGYRPGDTPAALLERADLALYKAKTGGGNRVAGATPPAPSTAPG